MTRAPWAVRRRAMLATGEIARDSFGTGPPVVLVHGTPSWSYLWRNVVPGLARSFTSYAFGLLGYGNSPAPEDAGVSIPAQASLLDELPERGSSESRS